ncbi:putative mitochondrial thymidine kinase [Leptomonas pyrrhocoris]|uniref:Thymidine kinase n=1 Tax=Leptomonas pyrrhocoris TaxID=157538 RepID=A0A0M9FXS6_LEPPY|nr:putative mitochondrial thymidine kinase [Leptomonas pyrrhocoris]KPA78300.1 putative mitochondrial thymidine kinase [Leptomonas pyrrhocoris]|eukprot:XP_015656739.1 putative mitochondrial thymidine kinase [Leptomonas pyrrhocoris]
MFRGRIELVIGPMFAGKTTELMRRVKREIHAHHSCFVIKYSKDTRYDVRNIASHDQVTLRAQAAVTKLLEVQEKWRKFDVLAIDEGQFFCDLVDFCNTAADAGKIVMVSALDGDYRRRPFGQICELIPYCESVDKLSAVCMICHERPASFTRRTVHAEQLELIGGADMYIATCRECYMQPHTPSLEVMRSQRQTIREVEKSYLGVACKKPVVTTPEKAAEGRRSEEGATSSVSAGSVGTVDFKAPRVGDGNGFPLAPPPKLAKTEKARLDAIS